MEWQPIETAPKDRSILLEISGMAIEAEWDSETRPDGYVYGKGVWDVARLNSHGCGCCSCDNPPPTGWAELPVKK